MVGSAWWRPTARSPECCCCCSWFCWWFQSQLIKSCSNKQRLGQRWGPPTDHSWNSVWWRASGLPNLECHLGESFNSTYFQAFIDKVDLISADIILILASVRYKSGYLSGLVSVQDSDKCRVNLHVFFSNYLDFRSFWFFLNPDWSGKKAPCVELQIVFQTKFNLILLALENFGASNLWLIIDSVGPSDTEWCTPGPRSRCCWLQLS